jgi:SWI/SNF-related matrix-associated actin-dependent regulator 1 of chromatin subfamily A
MSYMDEGGTKLLATHCLRCGKPLRDPTSVELGLGPDCAEIVGFGHEFHVEPDDEALEAALALAPEDLRAAYRRGAASGGNMRGVSFALHNAGWHWEHEAERARKHLASFVEIATAAGYLKMAGAVLARFAKLDLQGIDPDKLVKGVRVKLQDGREGKYVGTWGGRHGISFGPGPLHYTNTSGIAEVKTVAGASVDATVSKFTAEDFTRQKIPFSILLTDDTEVMVVQHGTNNRGFWMRTNDAEHKFVTIPEVKAILGAREPVLRFEQIEPGMRVKLRSGDAVTIVKSGVSKAGKRYVISADAKGLEGFLDLYEVTEVLSGPTAATRAIAGAAPVEREYQPRTLELSRKLFAHQREGAEWMVERGGVILADDMGLGKTATSISALTVPAVIVCPATLKANWAREISMWGQPGWSVSIVGERNADLDADVVVCNYERLKGPVLEALLNRGNETLICDEAHALKNFRVFRARGGELKLGKNNSQRADAVWRLASFGGPDGVRVPQRFLLTGTPMPNGRHEELFPLVNIASGKGVFGDFRAFCEDYCPPVEKSFRGQRVVDYSTNAQAEHLKEQLKDVMLRRTKDLLSLPEKLRSTKLLELDAETAKQYKAAQKDFLAWYKAAGKDASRALHAEAIVRLTALRKLAAVGKVDGFLGEITDYLLGSVNPLIVMAHHREVLDQLESELSEFRVQRIDGGVPTHKRSQIVDDFQAGKIDVLLCSITAAGVGITLTRADSIFFLERVWRPFDMAQAEDRLHRIGQTKMVNVIYYDAPGTIDLVLAARTQAKIENADKVLGGSSGDPDTPSENLDEIVQQLIQQSK